MPTSEEQRYIEEFGLFFEQIGVNRTVGRIVAWLLIADPPQQSLDDLSEALGMAKSTVSTAARMSQQVGLIERVSLPGERRDFYQMAPNFWTQSLEGAMHQFSGMRELAAKGLDLLEAEAPERRQRLEDMYSIYTFLEREFPALLERWREEHKD